MHRPNLRLRPASLALLVTAFAFPALAGPDAGDLRVAERAPKDVPVEMRTPRATIYGPILAEDPEVRAQIQSLYEQRAGLTSDTMDRIRELNAELLAGTDATRSDEIHAELTELKTGLEERGIEIGLQIAQLNGDEPRAAEYERALDQIRNPERYAPAPIDPSVQQQRLAEQARQAQAGEAVSR